MSHPLQCIKGLDYSPICVLGSGRKKKEEEDVTDGMIKPENKCWQERQT